MAQYAQRQKTVGRVTAAARHRERVRREVVARCRKGSGPPPVPMASSPACSDIGHGRQSGLPKKVRRFAVRSRLRHQPRECRAEVPIPAEETDFTEPYLALNRPILPDRIAEVPVRTSQPTSRPEREFSEDAMKTSSAAVSTGQCIEMLFKVREVPVAPILVGDPRIARRRAPCWPQPIRSWLNRSRP